LTLKASPLPIGAGEGEDARAEQEQDQEQEQEEEEEMVLGPRDPFRCPKLTKKLQQLALEKSKLEQHHDLAPAPLAIQQVGVVFFGA